MHATGLELQSWSNMSDVPFHGQLRIVLILCDCAAVLRFGAAELV